MDRLYLAIDNGGTKAAALLFDGDFHLIAAAKSGSLRANTTAAELVDAHFEDLMSQLGLSRGTALACIGGTFERAIGARLSERFSIGEVIHTTELDLGLGAAEIFGDGLLALSGTGATMYARIGGVLYSSGGYGAAVADEGSGYWISREAMIAAIRDYEGRGPSTSLTELIAERFGFRRDELRSAIFSIYYTKSSPVAQVAGLVPLVVDAAEGGDNAAQEILVNAGRLMADQMLSLIRKYNAAGSIPLTVSGSVWRGNPLFGREFASRIRAEEPDRQIIIPRYEPVAGFVIDRMNAQNENRGLTEKDRAILENEYARFRYNLNYTI
ncbi:MAG: hypothetical protein J5950_09540 [Clostridia bacterium]|nr:hypothetical protein [Clostridia bacterium]